MNSAWPLVRLGEVLRRVERIEVRDELTEYSFAGTYSFARGIFLGGRKMGSEFALPRLQRIRAGDFIYCKIMAWEGAFGLAPAEVDNCVMSGAFVAYEFESDKLDPRFLDWFFKLPKNWRSLGGQSTGTNVRRQSLHPSQFEKSEIPLPPLAEQQRIVARIEELATQIQEARSIQHTTEIEAEALENRAAEAIFSKLLASGIEAVPFEAACRQVTVGHVSSMRHAYRDEGVPFLRSQNVRKNRFEPKGLSFIAQEFHTSNPKSSLSPGDIVIVRTGFVGVACVIPDSLTESNCADLVIVHPNSQMDPHYAAHFLNSPSGRERAARASVGSAQKHYNVGALKKTVIPLPPISEQRRIVAELDTLQAEVDKLKQLQAESAAELDALLPAILDRAFKGELV